MRNQKIEINCIDWPIFIQMFSFLLQELILIFLLGVLSPCLPYEGGIFF